MIVGGNPPELHPIGCAPYIRSRLERIKMQQDHVCPAIRDNQYIGSRSQILDQTRSPN